MRMGNATQAIELMEEAVRLVESVDSSYADKFRANLDEMRGIDLHQQ
jgi:hypothetical protein